jgi:hypothetical protein
MAYPSILCVSGIKGEQYFDGSDWSLTSISILIYPSYGENSFKHVASTLESNTQLILTQNSSGEDNKSALDRKTN